MPCLRLIIYILYLQSTVHPTLNSLTNKKIIKNDLPSNDRSLSLKQLLTVPREYQWHTSHIKVFCEDLIHFYAVCFFIYFIISKFYCRG